MCHRNISAQCTISLDIRYVLLFVSMADKSARLANGFVMAAVMVTLHASSDWVTFAVLANNIASAAFNKAHHDGASSGSTRSLKNMSSAAPAAATSSGSTCSSGQWLTPPLFRTKSIATCDPGGPHCQCYIRQIGRACLLVGTPQPASTAHRASAAHLMEIEYRDFCTKKTRLQGATEQCARKQTRLT